MNIYIVKPGDTVSGIAQASGISEEEIVYINQIAYPYLLAVGQALLLPGRSGGEAEAEAGGSENAGETGDGRRSAVMGGYAYPFIDEVTLSETLSYLTSVSVFSYGFRPDGTLVPPRTDDGRLIRSALDRGVRPILTLTPFDAQERFSTILITSMLHNPPARENLIRNLLAIMPEKQFAGVDLDFEFVRASDRDLYTAFTAELRGRMNEAGYTVSVALPPKISDDQAGLFYEGIDYAGLGAAADSVLLMTYEWGYAGSPPMAVAPLDQVRRVTEYAVTRISPAKICLGIPNYGYDWTLPSGKDAPRVRTVGNVEAVQQAAEKGAEIFFDETAQTPYYSYIEDGVTHEVWFEDVRSIAAKFSLIGEYGLRGAGYWQLMRLFRANWILAEDTFRIAGRQ